MIREIITIDEELCDGCGLCIPACHEGALQIVDGKAKLVSDRVCDGLGDCLGHCPQGAIRIEKREAEAFDEQAVAAQRAHSKAPATPCALSASPSTGGCPGSRFAQFERPARDADAGPGRAAADSPEPSSELTHWPVQLHLLSARAPVLQGAQLLVAADCVPIAYAGFHRHLLRGRSVVIGCPKFDDVEAYVEKLTEMIRQNDMAEITVAYMEVPCCTGIVQMVLEARRRAGSDIPVNTVLIGTQGEVKMRAQAGGGSTAPCSTKLNLSARD